MNGLPPTLNKVIESFISSENNAKAKPGEPFERSNKKLISSDFSLSLLNSSILLKPSKEGFSKLNLKQRDLKVANKQGIDWKEFKKPFVDDVLALEKSGHHNRAVFLYIDNCLH